MKNFDLGHPMGLKNRLFPTYLFSISFCKRILYTVLREITSFWGLISTI